MPADRARFVGEAVAIVLAASTQFSHAFCGFYVAKADAKLFNKASQIVIARQDDSPALI